jgi:hypothetical protein
MKTISSATISQGIKYEGLSLAKNVKTGWG